MTARILIVEDDRIVARDIAQQLTHGGYAVVGSTASGEEALALVAQWQTGPKPDLVLMDVRLEGKLDGIDTARRIRELCDLPIVFLTAYADDETVRRATVAEPFGYVLKPFDDIQLRTVLEMALYKHGAEKRLRESEQRYAVTLSSIGDGVIATDSEGLVAFVNPAAEALIGWPRAEATGRPLAGMFRLLDEATRAPIDDPVSAVLCSDSAAGLPTRAILLAPGGYEIPVESTATPMTDDLGNTVGVVIVFRDMTQRRRAEEAEILHRAKDQFLANISHELRTPLNGILGYAQMLLRDSSLDARQSAGIGVIEQSGQHLLTLINDILDFTRLGAGKLELQVTEVSLGAFLETIAEIVGVRAQQKNLVLNYVAAPDLPSAVSVDERRLRQVLLNLLANAVKFTDEGEIRLSVGRGEGDRLKFEVRDTGVGISPDRLEAIFQPFEQAGDHTRRTGGAGLGLAISRQLVRMMGGEIYVASTVGEGSNFWFELDAPASALAQRTWIPRIARGILEGAGRRILLVDDVAANRKLLADVLQRSGFDVMESSNGREALEKVASSPPDLIILDTIMPVMGGIEVLRHLRQSKEFAPIPVIVVSADASEQNARANMEAGASLFLDKPIDIEKLLGSIASLLGMKFEHAPSQEGEMGRPIVVPPHDELAELHRYALLGSMRDINRHADHLVTLSSSYEPFAALLRRLAMTYESQALLSLIEQYLNSEGTE
jgi:PAS domain S-box-containing protein